MSLRTISRLEWQGIKKRRYAETEWELISLPVRAGLIIMDEAEDFFVSSVGKRLKITARGYSWLSVMFLNKPWWATVMFDENGQIFQSYFDITLGSRLGDCGQSAFEDGYVDLILQPGGRIDILDRDEAEQAYHRGVITLAQLNTILREAEALYDFLKLNGGKMESLCAQMRQRLWKTAK